ncbi:hypothetical protein ACWGCW_34385 [Streptomyces sp. NPDC054933]
MDDRQQALEISVERLSDAWQQVKSNIAARAVLRRAWYRASERSTDRPPTRASWMAAAGVAVSAKASEMPWARWGP